VLQFARATVVKGGQLEPPWPVMAAYSENQAVSLNRVLEGSVVGSAARFGFNWMSAKCR
jgi:hypothetical protein